jgi:hypothetical protein
VIKKMDKQTALKSTFVSTLNCERVLRNQYETDKIMFVGDSHVRGCASELMK